MGTSTPTPTELHPIQPTSSSSCTAERGHFIDGLQPRRGEIKRLRRHHHAPSFLMLVYSEGVPWQPTRMYYRGTWPAVLIPSALENGTISFSSLLAAPLHMSFIGLSYGYVFQRLPCCASSEIKECSWVEKLISSKVVLHFDHTHHSPLCTDYKPVFHFPASTQEVQWKFYG